MKTKPIFLITVAVFLSLLLALPAVAQTKRKRPKRLRGSVGLVDHEKNYMVLVTPKGKLVRVKFTDKTRVIKLVPEKAEMKDIRVRSRSTVSISYETKDGENILKSIEYKGRAKKKKPK